MGAVEVSSNCGMERWTGGSGLTVVRAVGWVFLCWVGGVGGFVHLNEIQVESTLKVH